MYRREEAVGADFLREAGAFENIAQGQIRVRDFQGDASFAKFFVKAVKSFGGGYVNVSDRLGIEQKPAKRRGAGGDKVANALDEMADVGKQQRRVEAIGDQSWEGLSF